MQKHLASLLLLSLAACGGGDPKADGFAAYGSGDYTTAVAKLDEALASRTQADADYLEIAVGRCQALAHVDAAKCQKEFLALAGANADGIQSQDYSMIISELVAAKGFEPAVMVVDDGIKRFTESPKLVQLKDKIVQESKKAGDAGALKALDGLGYLGDD